MVLGQRACVLLALLICATDAKLSETCTEADLLSSATTLPQALLQAHRTINPISSESFIAEAEAGLDQAAPNIKEVDRNAPNFQEMVYTVTKVNPSGAAAPLTNEGYLAVADRCCQIEMKQFIERVIFHLDLHICEDPGGLAGIVQYHTTPHRPQSFDKLTADLLADSQERCRWLAPKSETCAKRPKDCQKFEGIIPEDCGCSRGAAAKLDFAAVSVPTNNLAGLGPGPNTDPEEIRYSSGASSEREAFELVVTAIDSYTPKDSSKNGRKHGFGAINIMGNTTSSFRFSIVEPGTNTPVKLSEVHLAIFDLDGIYVQGLESVSSKGYHGYVTDEKPSVVVSLSPDGTASFTGNSGELANPIGPNKLTREQSRNSIMFFYKDVSSFELAFGAPSTKETTAGRNLFFAFKSSLDSRCAK
jgi:hypothetical protein